jgi:hypothetical protein
MKESSKQKKAECGPHPFWQDTDPSAARLQAVPNNWAHARSDGATEA